MWGERTFGETEEVNETNNAENKETSDQQEAKVEEKPTIQREDWMKAPPKEAGWMLGRRKDEPEEEEKDPDNVITLLK